MKILRWISTHPIWSLLIFILVSTALVSIFSGGGESNYNTVLAEKGSIKQEVSVTGKLMPVEDVDLAFEKSGKVSLIYIKVGDKVFPSQLLAKLDNSDLIAQLAEFEANVDSQKAKLAELERGTRPEEILIQETKVESAKSSVEDAKKNLVDKLNDAYTKGDDVIRNKIDQFFDGPRTSNPQINFAVLDVQLENKLNTTRKYIETMLIEWKDSVDALSPISDLDSYVSMTNTNLDKIKSFLSDITLALNDLSAGVSLSQTTIDTYRTSVSTARTNINTATVNVSAADEKLRGAESTLSLEQNNLALKKAGTVEEQITAQEAAVKQAEAKVQSALAQISKTIIRSPISGTVTSQDIKVGEIVTANTKIISIISEDNLEIEANIPEVDIGKISLGNKAKITLDAFSGEIFSGSIVYVDPAETIIEGVTTYKIKLNFDEEDSRIRSGMTADIDLITAELSDVIIIPQRAVITRDGEKLVNVLIDGEIREIVIKTGVRSFEGMVEVISGLEEGEEVVVSINK